MFTEKLKKLREELKLTQKQMGKRLFMEQSSYSRLERNPHPKPHILERIQKVLGVDIRSWLSDDEAPTKESASAPADDALRIVHIDQIAKPSGKKKPELTKTEERTLIRGFELYLEALTAKLARRKKRKPKNEPPRGGGVITDCFSAI
ncbi:MAG: helix-turn-helix transcriptional regulator [Flavobacteriales bacterium]|nr:helix-turn-helix transcriptional regulator [Flavobacteriales bacterium]